MTQRSVPTLIITLVLVLGCGARSDRGAVSPAASPAPRAHSLCRIDDRWTDGELRTPSGAFEFVAIADGEATARIDRHDGRLRIRAIVRRDGWTFRGLVAPDARALRVRTSTVIREGVIASAGASVAIVDARAGAVAIAPSPSAAGAENGVHLVTPIADWVPCETVGFAFEYRSPRTALAERAAIGLPERPPPRVLAPGARTSLSASPGGSAFAELESSGLGVPLFAIEERLPYTRVLLHHWDGTIILGWVPSEALSEGPRGVAVGTGTLLGALRAPATVRVCVAPEPLELFASRANDPAERVGTIDPGTPFVLDATHANGALTISPHFDGVRQVVRQVGTDVVWSTRTSAPLECTDQAYGRGPTH